MIEDEVESEPFHRTVPPLNLAIVSIAVILLLFLTAGATTQFLNPGFGVWFTEIFIFLGVPFVLTRFSLRDPVRWSGMPFPGWTAAALGLVLGVVNFFGVVVPIQLAAQLIAPRDWSEAFDSSRIFLDQTPFDLALIVSGVVIAAPWCEEYFFRGVLQHSIAENRGRAMKAIIISAFLFSLFHFDPVGFVARFELGVLFGWLFWRTGSIWPSALAHAANNGISTIIFFASGEEPAAQAKEAVTREDVLQVVVLAGTGVLVLAGLLLLIRAHPKLLSRRAPAPAPLPPSSFWRLAAPWLIAGTLSLGLFVATDYRGIQLRMIDQEFPLPKELPKDMESIRHDLVQVRKRARAGEVPIETYKDERESLSRASGGTKREPTPKPLPQPAPRSDPN